MTRRPAAVTQADVARVIRAARQEGAARVRVKVRDAEFAIDLTAPAEVPPLSPEPAVAPRRRIRL